MYNAFIVLTMIIKVNNNIAIIKINSICNRIICMYTCKCIDIEAYNITIINFIIINSTYLLIIIIYITSLLFENDP